MINVCFDKISIKKLISKWRTSLSLEIDNKTAFSTTKLVIKQKLNQASKLKLNCIWSKLKEIANCSNTRNRKLQTSFSGSFASNTLHSSLLNIEFVSDKVSTQGGFISVAQAFNTTSPASIATWQLQMSMQLEKKMASRKLCNLKKNYNTNGCQWSQSATWRKKSSILLPKSICKLKEIWAVKRMNPPCLDY